MAAMTALMIPLAADVFGARFLGEATLLAVGAVVVGYIVAAIWPKKYNPQLFGFLAAATLVGGLFYNGIPTGWFATHLLGEAILIMAGAVIAGYCVASLWPESQSPQLFGVLTALAVVGGLSYMGVAGAGVALLFLVIVAVLAVSLGLAC